MTARGRILLAAAVLAVTTLLSGCTASAPVPTSTAPLASPISAQAFADGFVSVRGSSFELGGEPFRFVGANIYDAASTASYSCRAGSRMSDEQLASALKTLHDQAGATVLRFWAYQTYTQGGTDWSGVDRVIAAARAAGMKVLPVLEDGPGDCTTSSERVPKADYRGDTWFTQGYREPYGNATHSFREYAGMITAHYADDPTVLGWSLMNEADTSARDAAGRSVLVDFAKDVAGVIRAGDTRHPITVGTQSNGAPGASGPDFTAVYGLPEIDFAEVHDWGYWGADDQPMPGGTGAEPPAVASTTCSVPSAPIGCSFALAKRLGKPLIVGEAGIRGTTDSERITRARQLRAKMDAAFAAGASGYLVWSVTTADTDGYDVVLTRNDPLIGQLRDVAEGIR